MPFYIGLRNFLNPIIKYLGLFIYFSFIISYTLVCISDPGIPSKDYYLENYEVDKMSIKNYRICRKCKIVMDLDKNTEHCVECGVCVMENDHHCPWTSKCVGKKNIHFFFAFLTTLFMHIGYLVFALVSLAITVDINKSHNNFK